MVHKCIITPSNLVGNWIPNWESYSRNRGYNDTFINRAAEGYSELVLKGSLEPVLVYRFV
jgi:hypothetical protein